MPGFLLFCTTSVHVVRVHVIYMYEQLLRRCGGRSSWRCNSCGRCTEVEVRMLRCCLMHVMWLSSAIGIVSLRRTEC
jgi:hypothetical protein